MSRIEKIKNKNKLVVSKTIKEREPKNYNWLKLVLVFLVFLFMSYLVFFSEIFNIKQIEVEGYKDPNMIKEEFTTYINNSYFHKNIIFFRSKKLEDALYGDSGIKSVEIKKILPSKIKIIISESKPEIIWVSAGEKYLIDERGEAIGEANEEKLIEVKDASNIKVEREKRVASPTFVKFIKQIGADFERTAGTRISNILIYDILTDVHILTADGWTVYLDASKDPDALLKNLARVLEEVRKQNKKIQYIDLRLETKAYYK